MTSEVNLWRDTAGPGVEAPPLAADATVDLAILGGGFTGCAAALEAAGLGARVALVEAETIGHGGSGRNVGLVNAGLWLPPDTVRAQMGAAAEPLLAALAAAPDRVFALIDHHGISCEATRAGTLHLAHSPAGLRDLTERHRQGVAMGAPLQLLDADETARRTGTRAYHGALLHPRAGTIQPLAYARGLARAAQGAGARLHDHSRATALERDGAGWRLTVNGCTLRAAKVLVATNAYHLGPLAAVVPDFIPVHYSQFATAPLPIAQRRRVLAGGEGCWDTALVMSSFRVDAAGRLILGAIGNRGSAMGGLHDGWARRKLARLFPDLAGLGFTHHWAGRIAMTSDHVPKVVEFGPGGLAVFGYSGRGIGPGTVFGTAAARALVSGETTGLPIAPAPRHAERLPGLQALWYEAGATLTHATACR